MELSHRRVAERVAHGGHAIAADDIARRFPRSLRMRNLLHAYAGAVDEAYCLLNDGPVQTLVFSQIGPDRTIADETVYHRLMQEAVR